jgi:hypothetical protein
MERHELQIGGSVARNGAACQCGALLELAVPERDGKGSEDSAALNASVPQLLEPA